MGPGEAGHGLIAAGEMGEDAAAGGIGQSGEGAIEIVRILNHLVKY